MPPTLEKSIIKTLVYADLFDYPLTSEEICKRLIKVKSQKSLAWPPRQGKVKVAVQKLKVRGLYLKDNLKTPWMVAKRRLRLLQGGGSRKYFYLQGKEYIVSIRQKRKKYSQEKLKIARKVANFLRFIPTVKLVGVTGALAVENAKKNDDIDLFIVSSRGFLWTTRFLAALLVELTGKRRRPGEKQVKDKICLNMFVDESHLAVPKKERDLFSAYEVIQMRPLLDRDNTYNKFLRENLWVKEYLPNGIRIKNQESRIKYKKKIPLFNCYIVILLHYFELLLKNLQLFYMEKRRTTEVIKDGVVRFHPKDARKWVLRRYNNRLRKYGVKA